MRSSKSIRTHVVWPRLPPISAATIIGLDGVGRQVALQLAALGVPQLQLVDARVVTRRVQRREGYAYEDIGRPCSICPSRVTRHAVSNSDDPIRSPWFASTATATPCLFATLTGP